jgi:hypothetical protein
MRKARINIDSDANDKSAKVTERLSDSSSVNYLAAQPICRYTGEEYDEPGRVLRQPDPTVRIGADHSAFEFIRHPAGIGWAWIDRVYIYAFARHFLG